MRSCKEICTFSCLISLSYGLGTLQWHGAENLELLSKQICKDLDISFELHFNILKLPTPIPLRYTPEDI